MIGIGGRRRTPLLVGGAAVLFFVVAFLNRRQGELGPNPSFPPPSGAPSASPSPDGAPSAPTSSTSVPAGSGTAKAPSAKHETGVLAGIVRGPDGTPVPGAVVVADWQHEARPVDGRYRIEGLDPGELDVQAGAPGCPTVHLPATIRANQTTWLDVTLTPGGGTLGGRVEDASGQPLAGARFEVWRDSGRDFVTSKLERPVSGPDGSFRLSGLPAGGLTLRASAEGHVTTTIRTRAGLTDLRITLEEAGAISGRLVLPAALSAPAAPRVQLRLAGDGDPGASRDEIVTEPDEPRLDGLAFRLPGLRPGKYRVTARLLGVGRGEVGGIVVRVGETTEAEIPIDPGGVIEGRVLSEAGRPIAGAFVVAVDSHLLPALDILTEEAALRNRGIYSRTDAAGRFRLPGLAPAHYSVAAVGSGYRPGVLQDVVVPVAGEVPDLVLHPGTEVTVAALDAEGRPIRGATVFVALPGSFGGIDRETDGRGICVFPAVPTGRVGLQLSSYRRSLYREVEVEGTAPVRFELRYPAEEAWLSGTMTRNGKPLEGRSVDLSYSGPNGSKYEAIAVTDAEGHYEIRGLIPARATLSIGESEQRPYGPVPARTVRLGRGRNDLDLVLPAGILSVLVVESESGKPVRDARVTVDGRYGCITGADGRGRIEDVAETPTEIVTSAPGRAPERRRATATAEGTEVRFELRPAVKLEIRCRSGSGAAAGEPEVHLVGEDGFDVAAAARQWGFAEDATGQALLYVAPGAYRLSVRVEGYAPVEREIRVPAAGLSLPLEMKRR